MYCKKALPIERAGLFLFLTNKLMDWELYEKYGEYNEDGYYIEDYSKWDYYAQNTKLYKRKKMFSWFWCLIPIMGFLLTESVFNEMGISSV